MCKLHQMTLQKHKAHFYIYVLVQNGLDANTLSIIMFSFLLGLNVFYFPFIMESMFLKDIICTF